MTDPTTPTAPPRQEAYPDDEISLLELVNVLLRRWHLVVGLPLGAAVVTALISLVIPPTYTATTAFVPEASAQRRLPAGLAGLAGQFGITLASEGSQSPQFYAEVVRSRELMDRVLLSQFAHPSSRHNPPDSATLLKLLNAGGEDLADRLHRGRKELENDVSVRVDNRTNIVRLSVDSWHPDLAASVANLFVQYLNEFNAQTRQSQARVRREFVEGRIAQAETELRAAEEALRSFYERNRRWQDSPQLVVEEDRLRRQVQIRQELYLTLQREYESARIEEVNDTPVITVIDSAVPPQRRSKPRRALLVVLAAIAGGFTGVVWVFAGQSLSHARGKRAREYNEFRRLFAQIRADARRLVGHGVGRSRTD